MCVFTNETLDLLIPEKQGRRPKGPFRPPLIINKPRTRSEPSKSPLPSHSAVSKLSASVHHTTSVRCITYKNLPGPDCVRNVYRLFDFNGNHPRFSTAANLMLRNSTVLSVVANVHCAHSPPARPLPSGVRSSFVTPEPACGWCCLRSARNELLRVVFAY